MPTKPKINVRLLRRIQKQIAKEPRQFYMGWWFKSGDTLPYEVPNCGTAACVAGLAVSLTLKVSPKVAYKRMGFESGVFSKAQQAIGLTSEQANRLFGMTYWPRRFQFGDGLDGTPAAAKLAVRRIDHFIKTKGQQ